jgi:aminoglycoside phosphotransferase (APT) family kinase protein
MPGRPRPKKRSPALYQKVGTPVNALSARHERLALAILEQVRPGQAWHLSRPPQGARKPCFVARADGEAIFVKLDVAGAPLARLAELLVCPPLLAYGTTDGTGWVVQAWLAGTNPIRDWLRSNRSTVARIFHLVHTDAPLRSRIGPTRTIAADLALLHARIARCPRDWFTTPDVASALAAWTAESAFLSPLPLVPSHDEPNTTNMLVVAERLLLLDWDDATLADPLRDLGPLLWWYFPPDTWEGFLQACDLAWDERMVHRIHWFAARASLEIALWHAEHGDQGDSGFLADFRAAVAGEANLRG